MLAHERHAPLLRPAQQRLAHRGVRRIIPDGVRSGQLHSTEHHEGGHATGSFGAPIFYIGLALMAFMMFGWFGTVIRESLKGMVSGLLDRSYRMGMFWFIVSEVMFFAAFFGALFYARIISVPWLAGAGNKLETHLLL